MSEEWPQTETVTLMNLDADRQGSSDLRCSRCLPSTPLKFHFQSDYCCWLKKGRGNVENIHGDGDRYEKHAMMFVDEERDVSVNAT